MELAFEKCDHIFLVLADLITLQQFSVLIIAVALYCVDSDLFSFPSSSDEQETQNPPINQCCRGCNEQRVLRI